MILCLKCKRIWPSGTTWCGNCKATLGCRRCPEGHQSELSARCCTSCGSGKLSKGVPALRLRFITWLAVCLVSAILVPFVLNRAELIVKQVYVHAVNMILPLLVTLCFLSLLIACIFGARGGKLVSEFWLALTRLVVLTATLAARAIASVLKKTRCNGTKE